MKAIKNIFISLLVMVCLTMINTNHCLASSNTDNELLPPCVSGSPTVVNGSRCGTGTVALSITSAPSGFVVRWYNSTGATLLYTSDGDLNWTTPSISSTTSYMVAWYRFPDGCTSGKVSITATVNPPLTVNAGTDQTGSPTCGLTSVNLSASPSTGTWSVVSGTGGSFGNSSSATSTFSGTSGTTYTLRWTGTSGGCSGTDDVVIKFNQNPTTPNAGSDIQSACDGTSVSLSASPSTGHWTLAVDSSPGGSFGNASSATSSVSGSSGGIYGAIWTVTNGPCSLQDETIVTLRKNPTAAAAGADQTSSATCGLTSITLAGNTPTVGTGNWSVISGSGGSPVTPTSATSAFSGVAGSTYTLRWTTTNMTCSSTDDMVVTLNRYPTTANAGPDQTGSSTCGQSSITLAGNTTVGSGSWSIISGPGGNVVTPSDKNSTFTGTVDVTYQLRWTTSNSPCGSTTDDVLVKINKKPTISVSPSSQTICSGQTATINFSNPDGVSGTTFSWKTNVKNADTPPTSAPANLISGMYWTSDGVSDGRMDYNVIASSSICKGDSTTATVIIHNIPDKPAPMAPLFYGAAPAKFETIAPDSATTQWYAAASGGSAFTTGNSYTNPAIGSPLTYYVSFKNQSNTCESERVAITAISIGAINPPSIVEETIRVSGQTTEANVNSLNNSIQKAVTVTYADGLSRTVQSIALKASSKHRDLIVPVEFDSYGRASKKYLPYTKSITSTTTDPITGNVIPVFQTTFKTDQRSFYTASSDKIADDTSAYVTAIYEASPLGRAIEAGKAGTKWQPGQSHSAHMTYSFNKSGDGDDVRIFLTSFTVGSAVTTQSYADYTLNRAMRTDENGRKQIVFTDLGGKMIMRKVELNDTINSQNVDYLRTAYVYNEMGQLAYIIPPGGFVALQSNSWTLTQAILDGHLYQFVYDNRGRLIKKKTPGQDWIYFGYDKLNRLVLAQDGNIRSANKWTFIKYDQRGRVIMTGFYTNATQTTFSAVQAILDGLYSSGAWYETRGTTLMGYTNQSFPTQNADTSALDVMSVSYFDNYDFDNNGTADYTYDNSHISGLPTNTSPYMLGSATGSQRKIIGTSTWLKNVIFYDNFGRVIQTQSNNHLNTTVADKGSVLYDFEGKMTTQKNFHNAGGSNQVTIVQAPVYDSLARVSKLQHSINGAASQTLAKYEYNEVGQVVAKRLHNTSGSSYMQTVDFRYNINGWLTSINNAQLTNDGVTNNDTDDYFGMELLYDGTETGLSNISYYNGNISAVKWKNPHASGAKGQSSYTYTYDKTEKLRWSKFRKHGATTWDLDVNTMNESMTYDYNGNILGLHRYTGDSLSGVHAIDNLTYTYANPNLLSKVEDYSGITDGFKNGANTTTEYTYDVNGNVTADSNKGISAITYNVLGKAQQITFSDGRTIVYTYDAAGTKLKMAVTVSGVTTNTDYVNGFVYTNSTLDFFASPEGRVKKNGSNFEYQYSIADHQGNTRVMFTSATSAPQTVTATFETAAQTTEATHFENYPSSSGINTVSTNNTTPGGTRSQVLNGGYLGQVGVARSYAVLPGDNVKIEAKARYDMHSGQSDLNGFAMALLAAFQLPTPGLGEVGTASSALDMRGVLSAAGWGDGSPDQTDVRAFVNILIFDKNYKFLDVAYSQVTATGSPGLVSANYTIKEPGYAYLYISNEDSVLTDVYFDDVAMTYTPGNIIQSNEYYPFGLQTAESWTRDNNKNNFLYNEGSELNTTSGLYDLPYRNYDAALGRFFQVDPMASSDHDKSPFVYAGNNPIGSNDPSGLMVDYTNSNSNPDYVYQKWQDAENRANLAAYMASMWAEDSTKPGGGGGIGMTVGQFLNWGFANLARGGSGGSWSNGVATVFTGNADAVSSVSSQGFWFTTETLEAHTVYENFQEDVDGALQTVNLRGIEIRLVKTNRFLITASQGDNASPWQVGWEWLTGSGPRNHNFTNGDQFTELLRQHSHIEDTRNLIRNGSKKGLRPYSLSGVDGIGKYLKDYSTLATGGLTGNLAVTYLGSYNLSYEVTSMDGNIATVVFDVSNSSNVGSATHLPYFGYLPGWNANVATPLNNFFSTGAMSEVTQNFHWTENIILH